MAKPPHVERIEAEQAELRDRIDKLDTFIGENPIFGTLPPIDQYLLCAQSNAMEAYASILLARLDRAVA